MNRTRKETHFVQRLGWLRAAVLGANDGIISTASLIVGVASATAHAGLALVLVSPSNWLVSMVFAGSLLFLAALGVIGARVGGAGILKPTIRVTFWGALAMADGRDRCGFGHGGLDQASSTVLTLAVIPAIYA